MTGTVISITTRAGSSVRTMINIDTAAFETTLVVVEEAAFSFEEFWQYKTRVRGGGGSWHRVCICMMGRFSQGVGTPGGLAGSFSERLELSLLGSNKVVYAPDLRKPFFEVLHFT